MKTVKIADTTLCSLPSQPVRRPPYGADNCPAHGNIQRLSAKQPYRCGTWEQAYAPIAFFRLRGPHRRELLTSAIPSYVRLPQASHPDDQLPASRFPDRNSLWSWLAGASRAVAWCPRPAATWAPESNPTDPDGSLVGGCSFAPAARRPPWWRRWPIASSRPIPRLRAVKGPVAPPSSIVNSPGPTGRAEGLCNRPPFVKGSKEAARVRSPP